MRYKFIYLQILIICFVFCNCRQNPEIPVTESIEIFLPAWPPEDDLSQNYPSLARWQIQFTGVEEQKVFYTNEKSLIINAKKNRPFCITAQPITLLSNNCECAYFKPAGYLYTNSEAPYITWKEGYLSFIMHKLICESLKNGIPPVEIEYLISSFNWKKAEETIEKKDSLLSYNPWLIPSAPIIESILSQSFKSAMLNQSACIALKTQTLQEIGSPSPDKRELPQLLSSYIPENSSLLQKNQFTVMKNSPIIIGDGRKYGLFITCKSVKNISIEFIYLPIYIEDI